MPQLDTISFLTQYIWTLIVLFFLFTLLINTILPKIQQQLIIRAKIDSVELKKETTKLDIFKTLFQLK
uniref:ATP synthase F0 subunit 8 n=1 Tax=Topsentia ophiraphidites TaxID=281489 RepID=I6LII1_TOPOP|nr:ATP synthase F0 subunit 8 [Topsentia ophiraphidites]ABW83862.1 ATP synthase F0 subunit 8 [Topsentia ophiraphidites]